jgi:hypothetical protein
VFYPSSSCTKSWSRLKKQAVVNCRLLRHLIFSFSLWFNVSRRSLPCSQESHWTFPWASLIQSIVTNPAFLFNFKIYFTGLTSDFPFKFPEYNFAWILYTLAFCMSCQFRRWFYSRNILWRVDMWSVSSNFLRLPLLSSILSKYSPRQFVPTRAKPENLDPCIINVKAT